MSDDTTTNEEEPQLIGDAVEFTPAQLVITLQDLQDAVDRWNSIASDLFVGALGE